MAEHAQVRSRNSCALKSKVKPDFASVRTRVIPILKRVEVGDYPSKLGVFTVGVSSMLAII